MGRWTQFFAWFFHWPDNPVRSIGITKALRMELDSLPPGQCIQLKSDDGAEFTIMHADDFQHIAQLAGLSQRPSDS